MNLIADKNNKQQLIQAFEQIVLDRKKLEAKIATKQEEAEKAKNKEILQAASNYTIDNIVKGIADLQLEFGSIVNTLSDKLAKENSKLDELNTAIEVEIQRLQQLQKIRIVADTIDILTQEHQEKLKVIQQDTASKQETLDKELITIRKEWEKEQGEYEDAVATYNISLTKLREKETEEYQYKLENTRKINTDIYEAKKRNQERDIQTTNQEKEKDWVQRERILQQNQSLFNSYQQKVAGFPTELEETIKKTREEAIKETNQKVKIEADLIEKEWEATKQSYELKIQALEQTINNQVTQIESISVQLQTALTQAQDLALRAFSGSTK